MNAIMNGTVTGRGRGSEPGGRRGAPHRVQVGHCGVQHLPVRPVAAASAQHLAGVCHRVRAAGVGALPPPDGHVGGQHPLLGGPGGLGVGGVLGRGHPNVQLWDEPPQRGKPPQRLPSKARPRRETQTPCCGRPQTHAKQEDPPTEAQVLRIGQQLVVATPFLPVEETKLPMGALHQAPARPRKNFGLRHISSPNWFGDGGQGLSRQGLPCPCPPPPAHTAKPPPPPCCRCGAATCAGMPRAG